MQKDWINTAQLDPRLPTDPEYVAAASLARAYGIPVDLLVRFAIRSPHLARTSEGNPWTESHGHEVLFLHEPSVAQQF